MSKFTNVSNTISLQRKAYDLAKAESIALDDFLGGAISEDMYVAAMEATEAAVNYAISQGVSHKDLPVA